MITHKYNNGIVGKSGHFKLIQNFSNHCIGVRHGRVVMLSNLFLTGQGSKSSQRSSKTFYYTVYKAQHANEDLHRRALLRHCKYEGLQKKTIAVKASLPRIDSVSIFQIFQFILFVLRIFDLLSSVTALQLMCNQCVRACIGHTPMTAVSQL